MPTIDVIPMTTPRTVSADRILFAQMVSNAIAITSLSRATRMAMTTGSPETRTRRARRTPRERRTQRVAGHKDTETQRKTFYPLCLCISVACPSPCARALSVFSFASQRLDRFEARGPHRRIQTEKQTDDRGDADAERDRPCFDGGWNRRERGDGHRDHGAEDRADDAAEHRQHHRLRDDLRHDVGLARAERLAQPDLARPLGDHHQHDVHDHDSADHQRQRDDADQHRKDAVGRGVIDVEDRVGREDAEVVRLLRLQPARDAQRHGRLLDRLRDLGDLVRLHRQRDPRPRSEHHLKPEKRNHRELVLRLAEQRAALRADADDAEMHPFDLNDLVERIDVPAEQPIRGLPAEHDDRARGLDFRRAHQPPHLRIEAGEVDVVARHALDPREIDRLVPVGDPPAGGRVRHHRRDQLAVAPNRARVGHRDAWVAPHLVELLVAARDRKLLDVERVGARLVEDRLLDRGVQPLNQRHHGDDRADGHDVAEDGHERPQLGGPDRVERYPHGFEELFHTEAGWGGWARWAWWALPNATYPTYLPYLPYLFLVLSTFTGSPSVIPRTEL